MHPLAASSEREIEWLRRENGLDVPAVAPVLDDAQDLLHLRHRLPCKAAWQRLDDRNRKGNGSCNAAAVPGVAPHTVGVSLDVKPRSAREELLQQRLVSFIPVALIHVEKLRQRFARARRQHDPFRMAPHVREHQAHGERVGHGGRWEGFKSSFYTLFRKSYSESKRKMSCFQLIKGQGPCDEKDAARRPAHADYSG